MLKKFIIISFVGGMLINSLVASTIYNNGAPNEIDGSNISSFVSADDFVISNAVALTGVTFWSSADLDPYTNSFAGVIGWGISSNITGAPGSLLFSGADTRPILSDTGVQIAGTEEWELQVTLPGIVLSPGTYWLSIHEGPLGTPDDASEIYWDTTGSETGSVAMATSDLTASGGWFPNGLVSGSGADLAFQLAGQDLTAPEPGFCHLFIALGCFFCFYHFAKPLSPSRRTKTT